MNRALITTALVTALSACQYQPARDVDNPYYQVPVGSTLVLNEPLEIPSGEAGVYVQGGEVKSYWSVNKYEGHCKFEMWNIVERRRVVKPDRFAVQKVGRDREYVQARPGLRYASEDGSGGGPFVEIGKTLLYLHSPTQPNVYRMTCQRWDDFTDPVPMSIRDIRKALGKRFSLELPQEREVTR
jgi:hypothetical protein